MPHYTATISRHPVWAWHYSSEAGCTVLQLGRWIVEIVRHVVDNEEAFTEELEL